MGWASSERMTARCFNLWCLENSFVASSHAKRCHCAFRSNGQLIDEQYATFQALEADKQALEAVLEADDKLATTFDQVKALTAASQEFNERLKELNTEKEAALKAVDYWKAQYLELEESLDKDRVD